MNEQPLIQFHDVSFSFGARQIYDSVSLNIERGKITAIFGPSGSGKTTLLKLIGGQLLADNGGQVIVDGHNLATLKRRDLLTLRARMGMLFQSGALFTDLNVFENIAFPLRVHTSLPEDMLNDIVLMKLEAVGLRGAKNMMPFELSGGMQRRVALARAIALDPDIIMYDEPFAGQDPISKGVIVRLISLLNDALGLTSIIVSHDIDMTAAIADYMYIVSDTHVIAHGSPADLKRNDSQQVQQFIQGLADGPVPFHYPAVSYAQDLRLLAN